MLTVGQVAEQAGVRHCTASKWCRDGMIEALREQGYRAEVCRGFDEASELILAYLRSGDG